MNNYMSKPNILIVDDQPENIRQLSELLNDEYSIMAVTTGPEAIEHAAISTYKPDIILLDILMPDMDGYEVCRRLKADPCTRNIPVIFITVKDDYIAETKGFELGAVDYITKPFNPSVVAARVRTHLELKQHRDHLEQLAEARANQLIHAERLAKLGMLSAGIAHEISNPLTVLEMMLEGFSDLLQSEINEICASFKSQIENDADSKKSRETMLEKSGKYVSRILEAVLRIKAILESMRSFSRRDMDEKTPVKLEKCIEDALYLCHNFVKNRINVQNRINKQLPMFLGNERQIEQVFVNLFKNAADAMKSYPSGTLSISADYDNEVIKIIIEDTGCGIPDDQIDIIWNPFFTTKGPNDGTGLGLSVSKGIIEDHNGKIRGENRKEGGARFIIELPVFAGKR